MLTLSNMRTLVAVVEEGSFTRAAERLNATQSGVSQQIAKLERGLRVQLLSRGSGKVIATPAGRQLYTRCVAILRETADAEASLSQFAGGAVGDIKLGLMPAMTRCMIGPVLRRFMASNPNAVVRVVEAVSTDLVERVRADLLDLAIVPVSEVPEGIRCQVIGSTHEVLVGRGAGHPDHLRPVSLASLGPLKLLLPSQGNIRRQRILTHLKARGVEVATVMEMDSMFGTLEYVDSSDFITILPAMMMAAEIETASMCIRPIEDHGFAFDLLAIEPSRRPASAITASILSELAQELAGPPSALVLPGPQPRRRRGPPRAEP